MILSTVEEIGKQYNSIIYFKSIFCKSLILYKSVCPHQNFPNQRERERKRKDTLRNSLHQCLPKKGVQVGEPVT